MRGKGSTGAGPEPIDTPPGAGRYMTMMPCRDGRPIFAYQVQELGIYRLLRQTETGWNQSIISKVDGDGRAGRLFESKDGDSTWSIWRQ